MRALLQKQVMELVAKAQLVVDQVDTYTSVAQYEADANAVRTEISSLCAEVSAEWGAEGFPVVRRLRELAGVLVSLRSAIADATATIVVQVTRETSCVELAVEYYRDFSRWTEIVELNPDLLHPGFIPAGTDLVVMRG